VIRDILTVFGLLIAIIAPVIAIDSYSSGGQGSPAEEQSQEEQGQKEQGQKEQIFATDPFGLEPGLAVVKMSHQGNGNFFVDLLSARQEEATKTSGPIEFSGDKNGGSNEEVAIALAQKAGPATVSRAVKIPVGGKHLFDVKADGPWTVEVEQPHPSSASDTASFSGNNDTATPFFYLSSGLKQVTITNPLKVSLVINLLDEDGNVVAPALESQGGQPDQQDSQSTTSFTLGVRQSGIYLLDVQAEGLWTIDITDVG
jgi:hypothetical protein